MAAPALVIYAIFNPDWRPRHGVGVGRFYLDNDRSTDSAIDAGDLLRARNRCGWTSTSGAPLGSKAAA